MTDFNLPKDTRTPVKKEEKKERGPLANYLLQIAKIYDAMDIEPDVRLLRDHLHQDPPLHSRRTLDQSYYWKLQNTDNRDEDQVVFRATKEGKSPLRTTRVVMVDQLWLYILDENTIISSFPRRWGRNKPDYSGVHKEIRAMLDHLRVGQIESVYDLALLIINQCSTVFFDRTKPVDERPELLDIFSNALSHISGMKIVAFEAFWRHLDRLSESDRQHIDLESTARKYLNINPEGKLLKEVHDIIEELRMMMRIFSQQKTVAADFVEHLRTLHDQERKHNLNMPADDGKLEIMVEIKNLLQANSSNATSPISGGGGQQPLLNGTVSAPQSIPTSAVTENTLRHAKKVVDNIALRRIELEELEGSTNSIYDQLKDLLSLKQQQASIIEAKYALKRADESIKQGRSVMLFTIVTIIFLPLSFMSSVFGMNASNFDSPDGTGNRMSLREQFKLLFPISIGVIIISISLAFSTWIRGVIYYALSVSWAYFTEYTYLRRIFVHISTMMFGKNVSNQVFLRQQKRVREIHRRREKKKLKEATMKVERLMKESEGPFDVWSGEGREEGGGEKEGGCWGGKGRVRDEEEGGVVSVRLWKVEGGWVGLVWFRTGLGWGLVRIRFI
ncbi:hypothetical protein HYALB_00005531 [Hymenoscyphus albidus]|uniref:Ankyrin repeat protein n=1 Tax=Hymenoscyphus albidus TaxID=595503 RepID=A0A9N9M216_9HELO|nr:hypothetical protein HYALB_00005531 [Hymenoscyphus albidus]